MTYATPTTITLEPVEARHAGRCPLVAIDVAARVTGLVVEYEFVQRFVNTAGETIAADLRLPLPDGAVVRSLALRQGGRTLDAAVRDAAAARDDYEDAVAVGRRAALAEEVRPNLLLLRVSALAPSEPIELRTRVASPLAFEAGEGTVVVPTTMTPRYCPAGVSLDDARRVAAPFTRGERLYGLSFTLDIEAGAPVTSVRSPGHALRVERLDGRRTRVTLAEGEVLPDRDVVVTFRVEASLDRPTLATARSRDGAPATVMLALPPPREAGEEAFLARHVSFLLDRSGSMGGEPIDAAKRALRGLVRALGPRDTFRVVAFDHGLTVMGARPVNAFGLDAVDRFLETIEARGGTEILPALERVLPHARVGRVVRTVVLVTDGSVANESEVVDATARAARQYGLRAHAIGIGPAVNRDFLRRFARAGHGIAEFVTAAGDIEPTLLRFQARSSAPLATGVSLAIEGLPSTGLAPEVAGDVDLGQPLLLFARVEGAGEGTAVLRGRTADGPFERRWPFVVPPGPHGNAAIEALWARARVDDLALGGDEHVVEVRAIGLEHGVVTPQTSLVAVDRDPGAGDRPAEVVVPLHMPAGLAMGAPVGAAAAAPPYAMMLECANDYDVVLMSPGMDRVGVMRALRAITGAPIADVKALLEGAPTRVRTCIGRADADDCVRELRARGATAHLVVADEPLTPPASFTPRAPVRREAAQLPLPAGRRSGPRSTAERVAAALGFLARAQGADGRFVDAPTTRLVLDAFAAAKETPVQGPRRRQLARAEAFWREAGRPVAVAAEIELAALLRAQNDGGPHDGGVQGVDDPVRATALLALALCREGEATTGGTPATLRTVPRE